MGKWQKPAKGITEQFLENEDRRRAMIIEAAKRRKELQKRLAEQKQLDRKEGQQALLRHKQSKKDSYVKYLRNNMHDKYQKMKDQKKQQKPEVSSGSKWKKYSEKDNTLDGLDLQVQIKAKPKLKLIEDNSQNKQEEKTSNRKMLQKEFERDWRLEQSDKMIGSKLLDSLDLDFQTLKRTKQVDNAVKAVCPPEEQEINKVRDLIGYDSMLISVDQTKPKTTLCKETHQNKGTGKGKKPTTKNNPQNEGELLNFLKNKKQAKILNWAADEAEDADELFSNCSKKSQKTLKEINEEIKQQNKAKVEKSMKKKALEAIPESKPNKNIIIRTPSVGKKNPPKSDHQEKAATKINANPPKSQSSQQRQSHTTTTCFESKQSRRSLQKKEGNRSVGNQYKSKGKLPPLVAESAKKNMKQQNIIQHAQYQQLQEGHEHIRRKNQHLKNNQSNSEYTVTTQENQFEIDQFIKNELISINKQERQIQEDLRAINPQHKQQIREMKEKYAIKTDYAHSNEIGENEQASSYTQKHKPQTQEELQESIQRLDDMIIRRDLESKANSIAHQSNISQETIINPFSNPIEFHKQVLQLADNISKDFKKKNEEQNSSVQRDDTNQRDQFSNNKGYSYSHAMKKKKSISKANCQEDLATSEHTQGQQPKVSLSSISKPPLLEYSKGNSNTKKQLKNECQNEANENKRYQDQEMDQKEDFEKNGVIHVNEKLKNILFD